MKRFSVGCIVIFLFCFLSIPVTSFGASENGSSEQLMNIMYEESQKAFGNAVKFCIEKPELAQLEFERGVKILENMANKGDSKAMLGLAMIYEDVPGLTAKMTSMKWYVNYMKQTGENEEINAKVVKLRNIAKNLSSLN